MRILTLLIAILIATLAAPGLRADEAPGSIEQFNARLDRARATLDEVQKTLEQPELSDAALRSLRARIEPLPHELEETIEKLTPRLAAIDARLKELAPAAAKPQEPPKEAPKAPETPAESKPPGQTCRKEQRREAAAGERAAGPRARSDAERTRTPPTRPRASALTPNSKSSVAFTTRSTRL